MTDQGKSFKIPWALDHDGDLTAALNGVPHSQYTCPGCLKPVVFKSGLIKAKHFSHKADFGCSWESYLHKAAKFQIKKTVDDWLQNRNLPPIITTDCNGTDWWRCNGKLLRPLIFGKVDEIRIEHSIEELRPDVVLLLKGKPVLGIEILVTHQVDEQKRNKSRHPWIELLAADILDRPSIWSPIQHNIPNFTMCNLCSNIDIESLKKKIAYHVTSFEKWLLKANNPAAALNSVWWINKAEDELNIAYDKATKIWQITNHGKPPQWENDFFSSEYCDAIYDQLKSKYSYLQKKPDDDIPF